MEELLVKANKTTLLIDLPNGGVGNGNDVFDAAKSLRTNAV